MNPGAFSGALPSVVQDLMRRLDDLERRQPSGVGVSSAFGATSVRPMQVGFPCELTGAWESEGAGTAYPWKQMALDGDALVDPDVQRTGTGAVAVDGDETLAEGTKGWLELDPQAGGWIFIAPGSGAGGGTPTTAGGCGWVAGLTSQHCLEVTLLAVAGKCACNPVDASDPFIITGGSTTWTYPGPPDDDPDACGQCPDGSPERWAVTLASGTSDFAALNGTYTLTRDGLDKCLWEGSGGTGATAGLGVSGDNWTLTVTAGGTSATWTVTRAGCCGPLAMTPGANSGTGTVPTLSAVALAAACPGTVLICGVAYAVTFTINDCGQPCLSLASPTGSGGTIRGALESCTVNTATFLVGGSLCTGAGLSCDPSKNFARIQVKVALCGWYGPGWYCVKGCDADEDECAPVELVEGDQYDLTIQICSGPYEDEAAALTGCGLVPVECCMLPAGTIAKNQFTFTLSGVTNGTCTQCPAVHNTTRVVTYNGENLAGCCKWEVSVGGTDFCAAPGSWTFRTTAASRLELYYDSGTLLVQYLSPVMTWDGVSPVTLSLNSTGPRCATWPATVTVYPV